MNIVAVLIAARHGLESKAEVGSSDAGAIGDDVREIFPAGAAVASTRRIAPVLSAKIRGMVGARHCDLH